MNQSSQGASSASPQQAALLEITKALQFISHKDACLEAVLRTPSLVHTESDPIKFLRYAKFDALEAAFRLAMYWFQRKRIFGDRTFLPMTLTGEGAMDADDVAAYRKGYIRILPTSHGHYGDSVWCNQAGFSTLSLKERRRCLFYTWSVLAESTASSSTQRGVNVVGYMGQPSLVESCQEHADLVLEAFPLTINAVHVFCTPEQRLSSALISKLTESVVKMVGTVIFQNTKLYLELDANQRMLKMISLGFRRDFLPEDLGGSCEQAAIDHWFNDRLRRDQVKQCSLLGGAAPQTPQKLLPMDSSDTAPRLDVQSSLLEPGSVATRILGQLSKQDKRSGLSTPNYDADSIETDANPESLDERKAAAVEDEYTRLGLDSAMTTMETEELRASSRRAFEEALDNIPAETKAAYLDAVKMAPQVVVTESDALPFLRCNDFDAIAAAKQMVDYWNLRAKIFGDRAFLPMIQGGCGALTNDDIVVLSSGSAALLPNDSKRRSVLIADRSRSLDSVQQLLESKLRCFFYLMSVIAENEVSQNDGYVILCVLVTPRFSEFYDEFAGRCVAVQRVMPARLKAMHQLVCPPKTGKLDWVTDIVTTATTKATSAFGNRSLTHTVNSTDLFLEKLERFGLGQDGLPPSAGGRWNYEEFIHWQRARCHFEQATRKESCNVKEAGSFPHVSKQSDENSVAKRERKRKLNIIHSRQKRERRRNEMNKLQEACATLRESNARVKKDNARLESLCQEATAVVMEIEQQIATARDSRRRIETSSSGSVLGATGRSLYSSVSERAPVFGREQDMRAPVQEQALRQKLITLERLNREQAIRQLQMHPGRTGLSRNPPTEPSPSNHASLYNPSNLAASQLHARFDMHTLGDRPGVTASSADFLQSRANPSYPAGVRSPSVGGSDSSRLAMALLEEHLSLIHQQQQQQRQQQHQQQRQHDDDPPNQSGRAFPPY
jgi:hypothetical protein